MIQAKRVERDNDIICIAATYQYLAEHLELIEKLNRRFYDAECILLMPAFDNSIYDSFNNHTEVSDQIASSFKKLTFAYHFGKRVVVPQFAMQLISKETTNRGFLVTTNDPAFCSKQYSMIEEMLAESIDKTHIIKEAQL